MRCLRLSVSIFAIAALLHAAKKPAPGQAQNDKVEITASVVPNDQVNQSFGNDFQDHFTVIEVHLTPKAGPLEVKLDDFLLRSDRDGDHSTPFPAAQIAGNGALVLEHVVGSAGPTGNTTDRGWRLGGIASSGGKKATTPAENEKAPAARKTEEPNVDPAVIAKLTQRVLAEKTASGPVSGLLFFPLEKQKAKDLELIYSTAQGKLHLRFK